MSQAFMMGGKLLVLTSKPYQIWLDIVQGASCLKF
jgi:hypothetical protein